MSDSTHTATPPITEVYIKEEPNDENEYLMPHALVQVELNTDIDTDAVNFLLPFQNSPKVEHASPIESQQNVYSCDECKYTSPYRAHLIVHQLRHRPQTPEKCNYCGIITKNKTSLQRHIKDKHLPKDNTLKKDPMAGFNSFICNECGYETRFKNNLKMHMVRHICTKLLECPDCDYKSSYPHHVKKHRKVHLKDSTAIYSCKLCQFHSKYEGKLERHMIKIHHTVSTERPFQCPYCDYSAKYKWKLNSHMKRKSKVDVYIECNACDFKSLNKCEMAQHEELHLPDIDKALLNDIIKNMKCKSCNFESEDHDILKEHESQHTTDNVDDQDHTLEVNNFRVLVNEDDVKRYQCDICGHSSRFKASIERHQFRKHTSANNKPFKCSNCSFKTKTKEQLNLHNKRSVSEYNLRCRLCDFTSFIKCQFSEHQKSHNEFQCHHCPLRFKQKAFLMKHLEGVTTFIKKDLPNKYKCRHCTFLSSDQKSMYCHELSHLGKKPFECKLCNFSSVRRDFMLQHLKKHKEENSNNESQIGTEDLNMEMNEHISENSLDVRNDVGVNN